MVVWQAGNGHGLFGIDGQVGVAVIKQASPQETWVGLEVWTAEAGLDSDLLQ